MTHLNAEQLEHFHREGYLVVEDLLDPEEILDPLEAEYGTILDSLATELYDDGAITSTHENLPFGDRLTRIYQESGTVHSQYFDFSLPQKNVTYDTPMAHGPAVFNTLISPALLDAVESIMGPEIYSNPTQHVRLKPPEALTPTNPDTGQLQLGATPWHQDIGVVTEEADDTDILTVWFPVWDADEEAGCLHLVPRSHREGLNQHCPGGTATLAAGIHIPDHLFRKGDAISVPLGRGSALFMHRLTCHGSLPNKSDRIRWSLDLRYNPVGQPSGRVAFPGFVARSEAQPETELNDAETWAQLWRDTREQLARENDPSYNRWSSDDPACA
jgi:ectoine hydroxylase-related dioxygenase (phytanoyl-CoA dioxygenase family)